MNYLAHADLTRYSEIYSSQRLFAQAMWDVIRDSAVRDLSAISLSVALGKADGAATVATLNSRLRTLTIVQSQMVQLEDVLEGRPDDSPNRPAVAASSTAAASASSAAAH